MQAHTHPLEPIVLAMAERDEIIDVASVAPRLAGGLFFRGKAAGKGTRAYRIVAADVLGYMASAGRLVQHGDWGAKPEDGGPFFTRPNTGDRS
jgi:hypothetical protein